MHGDGTQDKSYLYVGDCVRALIMGTRLARQVCEIFNLGSEDRINVRRIADIVCQEMNMKHVRYDFHSSTRDGRGWPGDVKTMQLDISKLKRAGWTPAMNSEQAVRRTVKEILSEQQLVHARQVL
jgi:UDP-glucose 4-epimerase